MSGEKLPPGVEPRMVAAYQREVAACWIVAGVILTLPLKRLNADAEGAQTLGPIQYPEIWREKAQQIMEDREVIQALETARIHVTTSAPRMAALGDVIKASADGYRPLLEEHFYAWLSHPEIARIPPATILSCLVQYIAARVPPEGK